MWDELARGIAVGAVTVEERGGAYVLRGAVESLLTSRALGLAGFLWISKDDVWLFKPETHEQRRAFERMAKESARTQKALAARRERVAAAGMKATEHALKQQQRKAAHVLKDAYRTALMEHQKELERIKSLETLAADSHDKAEAFQLALRRGQLESLIDSLASGLADAGQQAYTATSGLLVESRVVGAGLAAWQFEASTGVEVTRFLGTSQAAIAVTGDTSYHGKYDLKAWHGVTDKRKCREAIRQAITRGVLTGENPRKIAKRLEGLFTGSEPLSPAARARRIAQTEVGGVMNKATVDLLSDAQAKSGVRIMKKWRCVKDDKTRERHRDIDGETVSVDEKFSNGMEAPRVGGGAADRINCRCTVKTVCEGLTLDVPETMLDQVTGQPVPEMSYRQWAAKYHPELNET